MISLAVLTLALAPVSAPAAPPLQYQLDAGHSIFEFSIGFAFSRVKGRFNQPHGTMVYDAANPANSSVTIVVESNSIDTGWPHRDEHLRTSDFFDVAKFPTIVFQSIRLRPKGADWLMDGRVTMHGVTKEMTVPLVMPAPRRSPESGWMILNASSSFRLARKDFGIAGGDKYNSWFTAARNATMADSVDIVIEVEGFVADGASQRSPNVLAAIDRVKKEGVPAQLDRLRTSLAGKPDSLLMNYFTGPDFVVRELLEEDRARALELAKGLVPIYKGSGAHAVYGFALDVTGDSVGATREYAEAKRVARPRIVDPNEKFPQVDDRWYYLDQLVRTSIERGHVAGAARLARLVAELYPDNARAHATLGWALSLNGDDKGAAAAFDRALAIDPTETRAMEMKRRGGKSSAQLQL